MCKWQLPKASELRERLEALPLGVEILSGRELFQHLDLALEDDSEVLLRPLGDPKLIDKFITHIDPELIRVFLCWWYRRSYDPGPPCEFGLHFDKAPELDSLAPGRFRPEFGPVFYRGRLDGTARVLVVGQDPGTDEQLARRCFVGESGQRVQGLMRKLGLSRSYIMANTLHLGIYNPFDPQLESVSENDPVLSWRNNYFDMIKAGGSLQGVIAVGGKAEDAVDLWPASAGLPRANIMHPSAINYGKKPFPSWNSALATFGGVLPTDPGMSQDLTEYKGNEFSDSMIEPIPRGDLPWRTPPWFGTLGQTMSERNGADKLEWQHPKTNAVHFPAMTERGMHEP